MAIVVIAKNNTASDIEIKDLGITIPASNQLNLTDLFDYIEIVESDELKTYVNNAEITINDGDQDLNVQDGLMHIQIQSVYEDSLEDGGQPDQVYHDAPAIHVSLSINRALTNNYADLYFENKELENNSDIIEQDPNNSDRILIKESGLYLVHFRAEVQTTDETDYSYFRLRRNDTDVLHINEFLSRTYQNEVQNVVFLLPVSLNLNDFITVQGRKGPNTDDNLLSGDFSVIKMSGIQGEAGPPGGTTVDIQKDDTTIVTNCDILNFEGSVAVSDNGNNKSTITIIDEKYVPKIIQLVDSSGNLNVNVNTAVRIPFDTEYFKDVDVFDHSVVSNTSRVYVQKNGLYFCTFTLNVKNNSYNRKTIKAFLRKNAFNNLDISTAYSYTRNTTDDKLSVEKSFYITLNTNDFIELFVNREGSSGTAITIAGESILSLELKREL